MRKWTVFDELRAPGGTAVIRSVFWSYGTHERDALLTGWNEAETRPVGSVWILTARLQPPATAGGTDKDTLPAGRVSACDSLTQPPFFHKL
jgi:hypothetical protein